MSGPQVVWYRMALRTAQSWTSAPGKCHKTPIGAIVLSMAPTLTPPTNAPIQWPKVTIGKQTLEVRWGILAGVLLSQWSLNQKDIIPSLYDFTAPVTEEVEGKQIVKQPAVARDPLYQLHVCELFAACVAHNYIQMGLDPPKPIEWAAKIDEAGGPFSEVWNNVRTALYEALGKRLPATTPTPATPALTESSAAVQ